MPGRPRRWISCCWLGLISRLSQAKPRLEPSRSRTSRGVEVGQHRGQQLGRLVDVDDPARLAEQRRHPDVGGEDLAVAVEDVGPGGRHRVLAAGAARDMAFRRDREHDQPQRDQRVDAREGHDGEPDPRACALALRSALRP